MLRFRTKEEFDAMGDVTYEFGAAYKEGHFSGLSKDMWGKPFPPHYPTDLYEPWMYVEDDAVADRFNEDKVDLSLIPVEATIQECRVWEAGAKKYSRNNWKKLWGEDTVNVVMASAMRHMCSILDGERDDPETGLPHAAHVRCNMAMLLEYYKKERDNEHTGLVPESVDSE